MIQLKKKLNSQFTKRIREIKKRNLKAIAESIEKFKKTAEYKAVMLLGQTFKGSTITDWTSKNSVEYLACKMFKPKSESQYLYVFDERKTIQILAIDCKNLAQLKEKLNTHYGLKKKL